MNTTQVSVDVAKSVFQIAVSHAPGRVDAQHRLSRAGFRRFFAGHEPVEVLMEACGSAHHWGASSRPWATTSHCFRPPT